MSNRYRQTGAVSRRRASRRASTRAHDRELRRNITVHDVKSSDSYYIDSGNRYSAAHRQAARKDVIKRVSKMQSKSIFDDIPWARIITIGAYAFRVLALIICFVVIANTFLSGGARAALFGLTSFVSKLVPKIFSGLYVFQSPFGGAFRGDLAIVAIMFFVFDWVLCSVSASLRK